MLFPCSVSLTWSLPNYGGSFVHLEKIPGIAGIVLKRADLLYINKNPDLHSCTQHTYKILKSRRC
jgi:hypothetical protein